MPDSRFLIMSIAAVLTCPVLAQQGGGAPAPGAIISSTTQRIVEECEVGGGCRPAPMPIMKTVRLPIPGFTPLDAETNVYVMSYVRENGSGGGTAFPDEDGLLIKEDAIGLIVENSTDIEEEPQFYFTSMNVRTLEPLVTLDLHQIQLQPFLNSLQSAVRQATNSATRAGMLGPRPPTRGNMSSFRDIRVSIHGEFLTVDEVLDAIYLDTGCVVNHEAEVLVVASCP